MDLNKSKPDIRYLNDIRDVVYDKEWLKTAPNLELYYMYRDLAETQLDFMDIIKNDLRYDITILKPGKLGKEFNKTLGHDHPVAPGTDITYPELYEVLEGKAVFILQDSDDNKIKNIIAIKAQKNDKIVIPPNYEHLMINIGKTDLKTANWVSRKFESNIYKPFKMKNGFSYYVIKALLGIKFIKNNNYDSVPEIKFAKPNNFYSLNLSTVEPIYKLLNQANKLDFLKNPQKYNWN